MSHSWPSLIGAIALAMPAAPPAAGGIMLSVCGLPGLSVSIPVDRAPPMEDHGCCRGLACHAASDRKRRTTERDDAP